jgi:hypothetical protein
VKEIVFIYERISNEVLLFIQKMRECSTLKALHLVLITYCPNAFHGLRKQLAKRIWQEGRRVDLLAHPGPFWVSHSVPLFTIVRGGHFQFPPNIGDRKRHLLRHELKLLWTHIDHSDDNIMPTEMIQRLRSLRNYAAQAFGGDFSMIKLG